MALVDDLISYWKCDEASGDLIDAHSSNDMTDTNTVGAGTGKISGARDMEGTDDEYFTIASNASLVTGDIDFSWSFWFNPESNASIYYFITKGTEYEMRGTTNRIFWTVDGQGFLGGFPASPLTLTAGTWYFVVCWHDATNNLIGRSFNGGTPITTAVTHTGSTGSDAVYIGRKNGATDKIDGLIDEIGFWKRKLSDAEISELYNGGSGRSYDYINPPSSFQTAWARNSNQVITL